MQSDMKISSRRRPQSPWVSGARKSSFWCTLIWLVLASEPAQLFAAQAHTTMMVSANVLPVARLQMVTAVAQLRVSAADVALGYVDAPRPLLLRIDSNSRTGFALDVSALSLWCTAVTLQGFDSEVVLDGAGGTVVQRWLDSKSRSLALRARFELAATVRPGMYAWPLRLSARPL
jgi:hypothetical protein